MVNLSKKKLLILGFLTLFLCFPKEASAGSTYYVATNGNNSNPGTIDRPWRTIQKAASTLQAGDTVYIRSGTYTGTISPTRSGTAGAYITYAAYPGETPVLKVSSDVVINPTGREYLIFEGLTINASRTGQWVEGWHGFNRLIFRQNRFEDASGEDGGIYMNNCHYNQFINNTFYRTGEYGPRGSDSLNLTNSDHNLIEGNKFKYAEHALFGTNDSAYNVIRNNTFYNPWEKCINTGDNLKRSNHNLWEGNEFIYTAVAGDGEDSPGIQMENSYNILRYNVFYDMQGGGYRPEGYGTKASRVKENRIYNNVFYHNNRAGIFFWDYEGKDLSNSVFKNNILYKNSPDQIRLFGLEGMEGNKFFYNNIVGNINHSSLGNHSLSWWQTNYSSYFANNLEADPQFVNESSHDFHLKSSSPMGDAGTHLTQASSSGSGTNLQVDDALYFSDGFGIVEADWIKIGDTGDPVQISSINYGTNILTLKQSRTWASGAPVYLYKDSSGRVVLAGGKPDIGAFEYQGAQPTPTPTPTPTPNPYDLNDDKKVNAQDVIVLLANYFSSIFLKADFNGDGQINGLDFGLLIKNLVN